MTLTERALWRAPTVRALSRSWRRPRFRRVNLLPSAALDHEVRDAAIGPWSHAPFSEEDADRLGDQMFTKANTISEGSQVALLG